MRSYFFITIMVSMLSYGQTIEDLNLKLSTLKCLSSQSTKIGTFIRAPGADQASKSYIDSLSFLDSQEELCLRATPEEELQTELQIAQGRNAQLVEADSTMNCNDESFHELSNDTSLMSQPVSQIASKLSSSIFPLKGNLTCVRTQGMRGTCGAFAILAAVEILMSKNGHGKNNYSEQAFFSISKGQWDTAQYEGMNVQTVLNQAALANYTFLPGALWPYNPSFQKTSPGNYSNTCANYPANGILPRSWSYKFCSETVHQAAWMGNGYSYQVGLPKGIGFPSLPKLAGVISVPNISGPSIITTAKKWLDAKTPLVSAFWVTSSFQNPEPLGIINPLIHPPGGDDYRAEPSLGGHVVAIVGYVDNADLPPEYQHGYGGGYFIIKNSEGINWGDSGYALISYDYFLFYSQGFWIPKIEISK